MCGVQSAPGAGTRFWFSLPAAGVPVWTFLEPHAVLDGEEA